MELIPGEYRISIRGPKQSREGIPGREYENPSALSLIVASSPRLCLCNAPTSSTTETEGVAEQELTYRFCSAGQDCASGCICADNQCVPDGFGPANPDCGVRLCSTGQDCASGCICADNQCVPDGFGPANPDCSAP
jgi:hypothetical protein